MISLICPSRGRPALLQRMISSARSLALGNIEILVYLDEDDSADYSKVTMASIIIKGDSKDMGAAQNVLFNMSKGNIIMPANDDQIYRTEGWDVLIRDRVAKFKDEIYMAWVNDGSPKAAVRCAFPIMSRKWVETVGYFMPEGFHFLYRDTWIHDIAKQIGRELYIPEVFIEHMHFCFGKSEKDDTYTRLRLDGRKKKFDKDKYTCSIQERTADALKLAKVMEPDK